MKVIIAGSRQLTASHLEIALDSCDFEISEVVSGNSGGIDLAGEQFARECGIPYATFPANWVEYGRSAGPIRNKEMAVYADALIAVWDGKSRGTANMISEMKSLNKPVHVQTFKI